VFAIDQIFFLAPSISPAIEPVESRTKTTSTLEWETACSDRAAVGQGRRPGTGPAGQCELCSRSSLPLSRTRAGHPGGHASDSSTATSNPRRSTEGLMAGEILQESVSTFLACRCL